MKILYIDQPLEPPGGGQISLLNLLKNLDKKNYEFKILIDKECSFKKKLEAESFNVEVANYIKLFFKIKKYNPDIVHINSACTKYTFFSGLFSKILGKKVIWHNRVTEKSFKERIISFFVDKIIVISDAVKQKFSYAESKTIKIYNAVDLKNLEKLENPKEIRKKLSLKPEYKIIGCFSRLEKWKGHKLLIEAFSKIKMDNLYLLICGEGNEKENLKSLSKTLNIANRVIFTEFIENVYDYMNICDIIVNPSIEPEPFGRVVIEAMALGKPIISTNLGGPKEIIENGIDGILCEPNPICICENIEKLLDNPAYAEMISKKAKEKIIKNYSIERQISDLEKLYKEIKNE